MGIFSRLLARVPPPEGIRLDVSCPVWEVSGDIDFPSLLAALPDLLPQGSVLYFEGGAASGSLLQFLDEHQTAERAHVAPGTLWPKPTVYHVPATSDALVSLAELMRSRASPELAIHFHVYRDQTVLLEWHDVFTQPLLMSGELPEERLKVFAERLRMSYRKLAGPGVSPGALPPRH